MTMPNYTLAQKAVEFNHNKQCWEYPDGTVASVEITDLDDPTLLDLFWVLSVRERQKKENDVFPQSNGFTVFP